MVEHLFKMIGYSDSSFSSSLYPSDNTKKAPTPSVETHKIVAHDKRGTPLQLTPLWEHVVRTGSIPGDVDLEEIFMAIHERLRDPEWEVRQHALRVLVDVIPTVKNCLDQRMELLLGDLVGSLGHPGPAIRKSALDSLKVYLGHSYNSDEILRNIVYRGVEHYSEFQLHSDVVVGIILALPSLIFPKTTSKSNLNYIVRSLVTKLIPITFQEVSLRSLIRIRNAIGTNEFDSVLESIHPDAKQNFELLCQVYDANGQKIGFGQHDDSLSPDDRSNWNDFNANSIDSRWNSDSDSAGALSQEDNKNTNENKENTPSGKVILETEIQFNAETAFTMTILEEGEAKNRDAYDSDEDNRDCVMKILTDSENDDDFEMRRRTPRRVRFGGEIVKLRTPDSDSNQPSDTDNEITITSTSPTNSNNPVIEIKFIRDEKAANKKKLHNGRSLIPIPVSPISNIPKTRSLPTSPVRAEKRAENRLLYQSHPNLTRNHFFNTSGKAKTKKQNNSTKDTDNNAQQKYVDNATSPIPVHNEIELFHNLTRSPTRTNETLQQKEPKTDVKKEFHPKKQEDRKISTADSVLLDSKKVQKTERTISTANVAKEGILQRHPSEIPRRVMKKDEKIQKQNLENSFITDTSDNDSNVGKTFNSFILKDSGSEGILSDSFIPTNDNGECLTCSSSGSEGVQNDSYTELYRFIDKRIIDNVLNKNDWRLRVHGFETLSDILRSTKVIEKLSPCLGSLLHIILNAERHPRLQKSAEETIKCILLHSPAESLKFHLPQLALGLSKMGAPAGVRLSIVLMQKLSAKTLVNQLLNDSIISSRSAKTREGALQIILCATRLFPSTEFDTTAISKRITLVATDRKRRIRQASLDVLAVLGQIGLPGEVLESVTTAAKDLPEKDILEAAVRARLSRRQLPIVEENGSVVYASPGVGHGADVDWVAAGSGSISPCSARSRRVVMENNQSANTDRSTSAHVQRNYWVSRHNHESETSDIVSKASENWLLENKEESNGRKFTATQIWGYDHNRLNGEHRYSTLNSTLRPIYLIQGNQNNIGRTKKPEESQDRRLYSFEANNNVKSRGRSTSPPIRQNSIRGTSKFRGKSSSPPDYYRNTTDRSKRRLDPIQVSRDSSVESRGSPPRNNWTRDLHSSIPVPVSHEGKIRNRNSKTSMAHSIGSAPVQVYGRAKSPSPTHLSVDRLNMSQDTIEVQHTSSSESSEYFTPPAEPYVSSQSDVNPLHRVANDSFEQSEVSSSPQQERFIVLDSLSGSDTEQDKENERIEEQNTIRNQVYQKLQDEHVEILQDETVFRERASAGILSKSHADLSELKNNRRKATNSAPPVKNFDEVDSISLKDRSVDEDDRKSPVSSNEDIQNIAVVEDANKNVVEDQNKNFLETKTPVKCPRIVKTIPKQSPTKPEVRRKAFQSNKTMSIFPDTLRPFPKPREGMSEMIMQLESPEWEITMKGLQGLVRLVRHHHETVEMQLHHVCVLLGRHIKNLRSQVARAACTAASEMFTTHKKALEIDVEEIATPLLHRTADTNKFLRSDANAALDAMCLNLSTTRVVSVLFTKGVPHHNAVVRCATARLLNDLVGRLGTQKVFSLPKEIRDRIILTGANMLMEGSLETRKHAKHMLTQLSSHPNFHRAMTDTVPQTTMRHIRKILNNLK